MIVAYIERKCSRDDEGKVKTQTHRSRVSNRDWGKGRELKIRYTNQGADDDAKKRKKKNFQRPLDRSRTRPDTVPVN